MRTHLLVFGLLGAHLHAQLIRLVLARVEHLLDGKQHLRSGAARGVSGTALARREGKRGAVRRVRARVRTSPSPAFCASSLSSRNRVIASAMAPAGSDATTERRQTACGVSF